MNPNDPNIRLVEHLTSYLGDLRNEVVFVGGCAAGLLVTDQARPPVRPTKDVDVVTEITSRGAYQYLAERLRSLGFEEDADSGITCRWIVGGVQVDIMPTDADILGFSNRWYPKAIETAGECALPNGEKILLLTAPLFLATKLEAFYDRGDQDYAASHDMEDILTIIDGRKETVDEVFSADSDVQDYLQSQFESLLSIPEFVDTIPYHLQSDPANQGRAPEVLKRLRKIAGI